MINAVRVDMSGGRSARVMPAPTKGTAMKTLMGSLVSYDNGFTKAQLDTVQVVYNDVGSTTLVTGKCADDDVYESAYPTNSEVSERERAWAVHSVRRMVLLKNGEQPVYQHGRVIAIGRDQAFAVQSDGSVFSRPINTLLINPSIGDWVIDRLANGQRRRVDDIREVDGYLEFFLNETADDVVNKSSERWAKRYEIDLSLA